jgi:hypothetical protein
MEGPYLLMSQPGDVGQVPIHGVPKPHTGFVPHPKKKKCRHCGRKLRCADSVKTCGGPYAEDEEE